MTRVVHTEPGRWPTINSDRFAARIVCDSPSGCQLGLIGLPDDTGVRLNQGRPGAARGPEAFRAALARYGTAWDFENDAELGVRVFDAGDVVPTPGGDATSLLETHTRVEAAVGALHALGLLPVCIGGGHDLSLPSVSALAKHLGEPVGGINFDAHLDVRERIGSGMPFRRLIEGGWLAPSHFVEFGLGRFVNDASDIAWLRARGATLISAERARRESLGFAALRPVAFGAGAGFVSVDLDGLDSAEMSAVSALNPAGLGVPALSELVEAAGRDPAVRHFDIMEFAPELDASGRSSRVAAHIFLCFASGFARRGQ